MLNLKNYLTASGSYPARETDKELTRELLQNAIRLTSIVNLLLADLGIASVRVSSGFRPSGVNAGVAGAAAKSLHTQCLAVDIIDSSDQKLGKLIASRPDLLKKYGLWIEDLGSTKGQNTNWVHLDLGIRTDRPTRMFKP